MHKCCCAEVMPPLRHDGPISINAEPWKYLSTQSGSEKAHKPTDFPGHHFCPQSIRTLLVPLGPLVQARDWCLVLILLGISNASFLVKMSLVITLLLRGGVAEYTALSLENGLYFSVSERVRKRERMGENNHVWNFSRIVLLSGHKRIWK